jgi:hypothetical protein
MVKVLKMCCKISPVRSGSKEEKDWNEEKIE